MSAMPLSTSVIGALVQRHLQDAAFYWRNSTPHPRNPACAQSASSISQGSWPRTWRG